MIPNFAKQIAKYWICHIMMLHVPRDIRPSPAARSGELRKRDLLKLFY